MSAGDLFALLVVIGFLRMCYISQKMDENEKTPKH